TNIYILGGADSAGNNTNTLYRYNVGLDTYTVLASNPFTTTWAQAAAYLSGKIYWIGGCGPNCGSSTANVEVYDIGTDTWSAAAPLPQPLGWGMATAIAPFVYFAGGTVPADSRSEERRVGKERRS